MYVFQAEDGIRDYKVTGVQTCALPICSQGNVFGMLHHRKIERAAIIHDLPGEPGGRNRPAIIGNTQDRKSTRLNSSHLVISYAVFCLKKKKKKKSSHMS